MTGRVSLASLDRKFGASSRCRAYKCRCGAAVLEGWDADWGAFRAAVDPVPLGPVGVAVAKLQRRRVYRLVKAGKAKLTAGPVPRVPGSFDWVAAHRCGWDPASPAVASVFDPGSDPDDPWNPDRECPL